MKIVKYIVIYIFMIIAIRSCSEFSEINKKMDAMTEVIRSQTEINKGIIEVLKLREDPQYLDAIINHNKTIIEKEKR